MTAPPAGSEGGRRGGDQPAPADGCPCLECCCRVELDSSDGCMCVIERVDFEVATGEFVAILGRSGTGKTTLLRVLGGLVEPAPGSRVAFRGRPVDGPPEGVVFVFQNYAASLLPWRTIERNVALGLEGRMPKPEVAERVRWALDMVGLTARARDYPWRMSGGMQQRVQLTRALAMRPQGMLMDEPFGSLDAMTRASLQDELQRAHRATGATVVFVTHDIEEAVYLSDRILVLEGTPATIGHEIAVDLPRPRHQVATREDPSFLKLRRQVYDLMMDD
ncbi:MAG: ABC transporter ATP-binding protein [Acidimicrobiia bacterium]